MNVERISEQLPLGIEIGSIEECLFYNHVFFLILYYEFIYVSMKNSYVKFIYLWRGFFFNLL